MQIRIIVMSNSLVIQVVTGEITWDLKLDREKRKALWKEKDKKYAFVFLVRISGIFYKAYVILVSLKLKNRINKTMKIYIDFSIKYSFISSEINHSWPLFFLVDGVIDPPMKLKIFNSFFMLDFSFF